MKEALLSMRVEVCMTECSARKDFSRTFSRIWLTATLSRLDVELSESRFASFFEEDEPKSDDRR